ncbi:MAG: NAD kinase [Alphaproteobacteria bacterium]
MSSLRLTFCASGTAEAQETLLKLQAIYPDSGSDADVLVCIGGDGFLLETLSNAPKLPVYGVNLGTVGFLLNPFVPEGLVERVAHARSISIHPLEMRAVDTNGGEHKINALNEVALFRQTRQAAQIEIEIDDTPRMEALVCDGILVCTPAGSTAYNLSAHGPILPLRSKLLGLTPISAFRPRRWRGALLPDDSKVTLRITDPTKRPVSATADSTEVRDVSEVHVRLTKNQAQTLLFDPDHHLEERIMQEQFQE